jgi:hypothetical protein
MDLTEIIAVVVLCAPAPLALYWWLTCRQERKRRRAAEKRLAELECRTIKDAVLDSEIIL